MINRQHNCRTFQGPPDYASVGLVHNPHKVNLWTAGKYFRLQGAELFYFTLVVTAKCTPTWLLSLRLFHIDSGKITVNKRNGSWHSFLQSSDGEAVNSQRQTDSWLVSCRAAHQLTQAADMESLETLGHFVISVLAYTSRQDNTGFYNWWELCCFSRTSIKKEMLIWNCMPLGRDAPSTKYFYCITYICFWWSF